VKQSKGYITVIDWLQKRGMPPFDYQVKTWHHIYQKNSGLVNAPTGCGKTFSVFFGAVINFINLNPENYKGKKNNGLQLLWITPLRALAKDIGRSMEEALNGLALSWKIGIRNGDTPLAERKSQKKNLPEILIITPESLHLILAQKGYEEFFQTLSIIAVDEWHELLGSKRGIQVELAISRIVNSLYNRSQQKPSIWGISATIGNIETAKDVLLFPLKEKGTIINGNIEKKIEIESVLPDEIEKYPWSGHLGIKLADKVIPIILQNRSTLIFINTRGMSETWYQKILSICPELAGSIALHHGSISKDLRNWIEENLHRGNLKAVVCTSSLDLGVDFRPVETVIQVGSPKGVARFLQRAGRSGHRYDAISKIYFLPTHSLELLEVAALKNAIQEKIIESPAPKKLSFDVLLQYLNTLAIADGFQPEKIFKEIISTWCYVDLTWNEFQNLLFFITQGGKALSQYDEFKKVEIEEGVYKIKNRMIAMRHRLHIGTIVSEPMINVKLVSGGYIGVIEEYFISRLVPGDVFTLAGRKLEFVRIKDMTAVVRKSTSKKSIIPSWVGGRMPLSAKLGKKLRETLDKAATINQQLGNTDNHPEEAELTILSPLFELQKKLSHIPQKNELLIEQIETEDGFHLFVYPFEGRLVHEAMAAIIAFRLSKTKSITFSLAMNDYGFELLSDQPIPLYNCNVHKLFSPDNLLMDINRSVNSTEMSKRKFRDVSVIGGLIFPGMPGEKKKARHLQSSASLLFNVLSEYDPDNLLLRQSYQEVLDEVMEETRLREMLHRIQQSKIIIQYPKQLTPFCFPIKIDSMREDLSSEKLEERANRLVQLQKNK